MVERPDGCAELAETISRCRPQMICAYPDRAHPRILDSLRAMAIDGTALLTPHELTLRRVGLVSGEGLPPGPSVTTSGATP